MKDSKKAVNIRF